jgi:hypothetical protein
MKPKDFSASLQAAWGEHLKSVIRYGAAAVNDHSTVPADQSILVILDEVKAPILALASDPIRQWVKKGHPMPFIFDEQTFANSTDIFPIDYLNMQDHHEILCGADPLKDIRIDMRHLRLQCESEMRGKLIHLKSEYVLNCHKPKDLLQLMLYTLTDFDRVMTGILHLLKQSPQGGRRQIVTQLAKAADFQPGIFLELYDIHDGHKECRDASQIQQKFEHYLTALQAITKFVDTYDA